MDTRRPTSIQAPHGIPRRTLLGAAGTGIVLGTLPLTAADAASVKKANSVTAAAAETYRAEYHFTVPDNWKNDPQRPLFINGKYHYYYLYNADYLAGGQGTAWRLATTTDHVVFQDEGIAIPKDTTPNGDVWSGSAVVDTTNTAGFGAGAVIALVTMEPVEGANTQAQYLWYSTDGGKTFRNDGTDPVLPNPGVRDFRDPKVIRDTARNRWVTLLAEGNKIGFYVSTNLKNWTYVSGFIRDGLGLLECPDLFQIRTAEGTSKWILGVSANGKGAGLPNTYAYWTGDFNGDSFTADFADPQWLDHGFDWYGSVTWEKYISGTVVDPAVRFAMGWMNNWDYPHNTPTIAADGFNGTDSIVREITLQRGPSGGFYLASRPVAALDNHVLRTVRLGDVQVNGSRALSYSGVAYELRTTVTWDQCQTAGIQLRRSTDGSRHIDVGVHDNYAFVNRRFTPNPDQSGNWQESRTPFDPVAKRVQLRILVDRTTVEVFLDDGRYVHSHEAFPKPEDTGVTLFTAGGSALFGNVEIREFR